MFNFKGYSLLKHDGTDDEEKIVSEQSGGAKYVPWLSASLLVLFATTLWVAYGPSERCHVNSNGLGGSIAGLSWNLNSEFRKGSRFSSTNRAIQDAAWIVDDLDPARLALALEDSLTEPLGIPHAMRWPWDQDKGVYILQSGHELHCLHALREAINDVHDGVDARWTYAHQIHCLEMLLQSIVCYADDTPLYTGIVNANANASINEAPAGEGSLRTCRSWKELRDWADKHSACHHSSFSSEYSGIAQQERYKYCPDGSRPWETDKKGKSGSKD